MRWTGLVAVGVLVAALALPGAAAASSGWQELANPPPFDPGAMFLMTDGTVMVQTLSSGAGAPGWWRLTPDSSGSYVDGTWSQVASLPSYYGPGSYAAAVLPDGRLAIEGGEFNNAVETWSNLGAIYDPVANTWTMVAPPNGGTGDWAKIGDAPSEVLADGSWLVGDSGSYTTADAILNPSTLTWTTTNGPGKVIGNAEAGFTLLPNGKVLSVDAIPPACTSGLAEILDPATLEWSSAGSTPTPLVTCDAQEIGPQMLMYNGDVFVEGGIDATSLYDTATETWSSGPTFPVVGGQEQDAEDSGAALLPDGNVLLASRTDEPAANGVLVPTHFFLFDGTSFTQVADTATSANGGLNYMLLLPTGQVLFNEIGPAGFEIYTDPGSPNPADAPVISIYPSQLAAGDTYQLVGTQLNGLSDGAAFGDDYQPSTDFPLVKITNDGTGDVAYARTSSMTNRSIAPGAPSCTSFTLPSGIETGSAELRVIANGIASAPEPITIGAGGSNQHACPNYTLSLAATGNGSGRISNSPAGNTYPDGTIVTLTATPTTGSAFKGWSGGGCSGTGPCVVTMNGNTSVTATFSLVPETLAVSKTGGGAGSVTSSPAGISCGTSCSHDFDYGTSVALDVSAAKGSSFRGWSGDCSGRADCVLTMTAASSVEASFVKDCLVPKLGGKRLSAARRALKAHDCSVGKIQRAYSTKVKKGHVISEKPKAHKLLKHDAKVNLSISKGKKP
jgi:Divergent InlB B-repeat domain/PASTA domain